MESQRKDDGGEMLRLLTEERKGSPREVHGGHPEVGARRKRVMVRAASHVEGQIHILGSLGPSSGHRSRGKLSGEEEGYISKGQQLYRNPPARRNSLSVL